VHGQYALRYASRSHDFNCQGLIVPHKHSLLLSSGRFKDLSRPQWDTQVPMTDVCSLSEALGLKKKMRKNCHDMTQQERRWDKVLNYGWEGALAVSGAYIGVRWVHKRIPRVGHGLLAAFVWDKTSGLFMAKDNPIRKYGYYGAFGMGFLAPTLIKRALIKRVASGALLATGGRWLARAYPGFWIGALLDLGWGLFQKDYQAWVNKRVTDKVFNKHVYTLDGWDALLLPLLFKGVRAGFRFLFSNAYNSAVCTDNPAVEKAIRQKDRGISQQAYEYLKANILGLWTQKDMYRLDDPNAYRRVDLTLLTKPVKVSDEEKKIVNQLLPRAQANREEIRKKFTIYDPKAIDAEVRRQTTQNVRRIQKSYGLSEAKLQEVVRRVTLYNIQKAAAFMVFVDQPLNNWARKVFNKNGTLKGGRGDKLLKELFPPLGRRVAGSGPILMQRHLPVLIAILKGKPDIHGVKVKDLARKIGLLDSKVKLRLGPTYCLALTVLASEAYQSGDPKLKARLKEISQDLHKRSRSGQGPRGAINNALAVLGLEPGKFPMGPGQKEPAMCFADQPSVFQIKNLSPGQSRLPDKSLPDWSLKL